MLFIAQIDVDVLDAGVQQIELGTLVLVVRSAAVPALNFLVGAVSLWTTKRYALALYEDQSLTIWVACVLHPWRGYVAGE